MKVEMAEMVEAIIRALSVKVEMKEMEEVMVKLVLEIMTVFWHGL